jgi:hypothetical protein
MVKSRTTPETDSAPKRMRLVGWWAGTKPTRTAAKMGIQMIRLSMGELPD